MKLISHRGNIIGPNPNKENTPSYIDTAISAGYDVEIDIRLINGKYYLGHDTPDYEVTQTWLLKRKDRLWIHCKNIEALEILTLLQPGLDVHYFWHENDVVTLTSKGYIWAYPRSVAISNSIVVLPEIYNTKMLQAEGVCSDFIKKYKYE